MFDQVDQGLVVLRVDGIADGRIRELIQVGGRGEGESGDGRAGGQYASAIASIQAGRRMIAEIRARLHVTMFPLSRSPSRQIGLFDVQRERVRLQSVQMILDDIERARHAMTERFMLRSAERRRPLILHVVDRRSERVFVHEWPGSCFLTADRDDPKVRFGELVRRDASGDVLGGRWQKVASAVGETEVDVSCRFIQVDLKVGVRGTGRSDVDCLVRSLFVVTQPEPELPIHPFGQIKVVSPRIIRPGPAPLVVRIQSLVVEVEVADLAAMVADDVDRTPREGQEVRTGVASGLTFLFPFPLQVTPTLLIIRLGQPPQPLVDPDLGREAKHARRQLGAAFVPRREPRIGRDRLDGRLAARQVQDLADELDGRDGTSSGDVKLLKRGGETMREETESTRV